MDQGNTSSSVQDKQKRDPRDPKYIELIKETDNIDACDELEKHNMDFVRSLLYQSS